MAGLWLLHGGAVPWWGCDCAVAGLWLCHGGAVPWQGCAVAGLRLCRACSAGAAQPPVNIPDPTCPSCAKSPISVH